MYDILYNLNYSIKKHYKIPMIQHMQDPLIDTIKKAISQYVSDYADGSVSRYEVDWFELGRYAHMLLQNEDDAMMLHRALHPFYLDYLYGKYNSFHFMSGCRNLIVYCIERYRELGEWFVTEGNLMKMIDSLAANEVGGHVVFSHLQLLMATGLRPYIEVWDIEQVKDNIARQKVQKELHRGEYLCILHAFLMIEDADISDKKKDELEKLTKNNWSFLKRVYSIMVGSVIGDRQKKFTSVCNNVKLLVDAHPLPAPLHGSHHRTGDDHHARRQVAPEDGQALQVPGGPRR